MGPPMQQPGERRGADCLPITDQEVSVLAALATGVTFEAAARRLGMSDRTVRRRVREVCQRAGVDTTMEAITWAAKRDLISVCGTPTSVPPI